MKSKTILAKFDPRMTLKLVEALNDRDRLYRIERTETVVKKIAMLTDTIADIKATIGIDDKKTYEEVVRATRPLVRARKRLKTARLGYQMRNGDKCSRRYSVEFARFAKCLNSYPNDWRDFYAFELRPAVKSARTIENYKGLRAKMERGRRAMHAIIDEYASPADKVILSGLMTEHGRYTKAVKPKVKSIRTAIVKDAIASDGPALRQRFDIDALSMWVSIKGNHKGGTSC